MSSLLVKVRKKMSIYAHQKVRTMLDGEYGSVFKGRSMDFDDLRAYAIGDDIKDIDWRATARSGQTLIRRYVAIRKHNILLLVSTGRGMATSAPSGGSKRDISVLAAGVIAYVAQKNGDLVALSAGDQAGVQHIPLKGSTPHMERVLQYIDTHTKLSAASSSLTKVLDHVSRTIRRRMMVVVISDETTLSSEDERLLRRLKAQHEIMFIGIDDMSPASSLLQAKTLYDVDSQASLPAYVRQHVGLTQAYDADRLQRVAACDRTLDRLRISHVRIADEKDVVNQIVVLLERQRHAR